MGKGMFLPTHKSSKHDPLTKGVVHQALHRLLVQSPVPSALQSRRTNTVSSLETCKVWDALEQPGDALGATEV